MVMKRALERLYKDRCDVVEYREMTKANKAQTHREVPVLTDQPCRLSFSSIPAASPGEAATAVQQEIKLFIAPELVIKPGSKLVINHEGRTTEYKCSGVAAVYPSHQEIVLELFEGWA